MSKTVGNYTLVEKLGQGSYATVYKAHHKLNGGEYAVKVISREKIGSPKLQANLEQEISIMKEVSHQNVVRLYGTFTSKNNIYLVLEYCGGGDLQIFIRKHKRLEESVARGFLIQLARGLHFLHSKNVIHRDIKPQNLLLSEFSPNATIKFADFGFAKHLHEASMAQTPCGTPLYMAPEIFEMKEYDAKADVWSIGCVLFEMCTGEPPFKGSNHRELFMNIRSKSLRLPSNVTLSSEVTEILQRLLELNPQRRVSLDMLYRVTERMSEMLVLPESTNSQGAVPGIIGSASVPSQHEEDKVEPKVEPKEESHQDQRETQHNNNKDPDITEQVSGSAFGSTPSTVPPSVVPSNTAMPHTSQGGSDSSSSSSNSNGSNGGAVRRKDSGDFPLSGERDGALRRIRSRDKVQGRNSPPSAQDSGGAGGGSTGSSMTPATATMLVKLANPSTSPNAERVLSEHIPQGVGTGGGGLSAVSKALSSAFAPGQDLPDDDSNSQRLAAPLTRGSPQESNRYLRSSSASGGNSSGRSLKYSDSPNASVNNPSYGRDSDDFVLIDEPTIGKDGSTWKNTDTLGSGGGQLSRSSRDRDNKNISINQQAQQSGSPSAHWYGGSPGSNLGINMNIDTGSGGAAGLLTDSSSYQQQQSSEVLQLSQCAHRCQYITSIVAALTKHADSVVREILTKYGKTISKELDREAILGIDRKKSGDDDSHPGSREVSPRRRSSSGGDGFNIFSSSNQQLASNLQMLSDALCVPFSFYLHSMNYIQDAIQRTATLKMQQQTDAMSLQDGGSGGGRNRHSPQASSPAGHLSSAPASPSSYFLGQLDSLVAGLSQRFDQLMGRAESCQKWIRADATYPVPEPYIYQAALKLGQEAAVEELLGNLGV
jgi:serine/threonine-protein kinase ULK/ATG1